MCQPKDVESVENGGKSHDEMPKRRELNFTRPGPIKIEDALEKTNFGYFNYFLIFIAGIILYAALVETCGIMFALPVSQCDMNYSTQEMGLVSAVGFVGIIMSSHLWGFLADTKGRKRVMKPTLLLAIISTLFSTLTANVWVFAGFRFLTGFFISGSAATVYAYLGEFHGAAQRSRAIIGAAFVFGICCITLPLSAYLIINQDLVFYVPFFDINYKPWRMFMLFCAVPSMISYLALIILPESPKFELGQGRQETAIEILEKINRWNNGGRSVKPLGVVELHEEKEEIENRLRQQEQKSGSFSWLISMWSQTALLFRRPYLRASVLACLIQFGTFSTGNGVYMWFAEIINRLGNNLDDFTSTRVAICDVIPNRIVFNETELAEPVCIEKLDLSTLENGLILELLYPIGYAVMGVLINKVGKLPILVGTLMGCGIAGISIVVIDIPLLAIYMFIIMLCCGLAVTVVNAAIVELYPTNLRAMAMCMTMMVGRLGSVFGTNLVAYLLDNHCNLVFLFAGCDLVVCAILCCFIPNIRDRTVAPKDVNFAPRMSVTSRLA